MPCIPTEVHSMGQRLPRRTDQPIQPALRVYCRIDNRFCVCLMRFPLPRLKRLRHLFACPGFVRLQIMENLYYILEELAFPAPKGFTSEFASLGLQYLPRSVFLQYMVFSPLFPFLLMTVDCNHWISCLRNGECFT